MPSFFDCLRVHHFSFLPLGVRYFFLGPYGGLSFSSDHYILQEHTIKIAQPNLRIRLWARLS